MDANSYAAPEAVDRYRTRALLVGVVLTLAAAALAFVLGGPVQFFRSYLVGFFFCTGLAVGGLAWLMLGHMTGGAWALVSRRVLEASTRTLPLLALMFVPLVVSLFVHPGGHSLYEWSDPHHVERDEVLQHKSLYLNPLFFIVRGVFYFLVWGALAYFMNRWSLAQDSSGDPRIRRRMQDLSGPGILLFGLTATFAAVDWGMSLEPHWFSTMYGLLAMAGWGLSALAFAITVATFLSKQEGGGHVYLPTHFHDWGKLLLAMVMLYAYFAFSQFLIIWSGNLPEEISFYLRRLRGGWEYVGLAVILFHFALPFALLLSRGLKRAPRMLRRVAVLMLVMRVVDLIFLFAPSAHQEGQEGFRVVDFAYHFFPMLLMTAGLGGIWLWYFFGELKKRPLLPVGAPDLEQALTVAEHH
jgi:hypothetical protein